MNCKILLSSGKFALNSECLLYTFFSLNCVKYFTGVGIGWLLPLPYVESVEEPINLHDLPTGGIYIIIQYTLLYKQYKYIYIVYTVHSIGILCLHI